VQGREPTTLTLRHGGGGGGGRLVADGVAATCAFGAALDLPRELQTVFHLGPPPDVRAYWQEVGRAARRGSPSVAVLCLSAEAIDKTLRLVVAGKQRGQAGAVAPSDADAERGLAAFVELMEALLLPGCRRRRLMSKLMGGALAVRGCGACDRCRCFGRSGAAVECERDCAPAMLQLADHLDRVGAVPWLKLCGPDAPPGLPPPFHVAATRLQLVLLALSLGVAQLVPEPRPNHPLAPRSAMVELVATGALKLQKGALQTRLPVAHVAEVEAATTTGAAAASAAAASDAEAGWRLLADIAAADRDECDAAEAKRRMVTQYLLRPDADPAELERLALRRTGDEAGASGTSPRKRPFLGRTSR